MKSKNALEINGKKIKPGQMQKVLARLARLPSGTQLELPVYVYRSAKPGPVVLLSGGLHGDEINGIEIVRRMLENSTFEKLVSGSVIAVPVMNVYGFLNFSREVPDGKDINRSFPGNLLGSLAARMAHFLTHEVLSQADVGVDYHTGGASRYNYPQVRYAPEDSKAADLARAFAAPVILTSGLIDKSLRKQAYRMGKTIVVYEGGESLRLDEEVVKEGMDGALRLLQHLGMLDHAPKPTATPLECVESTWLRARRSGIHQGMVRSGAFVEASEIIGQITDPFGEFRTKIKNKERAFVLGHNNMPIVNQGDALYHLGFLQKRG